MDPVGISNFRDFGGYVGAGGRRIRTGGLFRSGHLGALTDTDRTDLGALDFALIVDLRRINERTRHVSIRPEPFRAKVLEHAAPPVDATAPHLSFLDVPDVTSELITQQMSTGYRSYPFDPWYVRLYGQYFAELADLDGPVLVHCHAGKDRTGVLCALTHHVLGVSSDDIIADYLLTNQRNRAKRRMEEVRRLFPKGGKPVPEDVLRHMMSAQQVYLESAFDEMTKQHGSVDGYLTEVLGVTHRVRDAIRERWLT